MIPKMFVEFWYHMYFLYLSLVNDKNGGVYLFGRGLGVVGGRHEAQAPSNQVKNYKQT